MLRMEFKTFRSALVRLPCQIVQSGRRLVYRLFELESLTAGALLRAGSPATLKYQTRSRSPDAPVRRHAQSLTAI